MERLVQCIVEKGLNVATITHNAYAFGPHTLLALAIDLPISIPAVPAIDINDISALTEIVLAYRRSLYNAK